MKKQEDYWLDQFSGEILIQPLPTDYPRPVLQSFAGDWLIFVVGSNETRALKEMAAKESASLYIVLLAVYKMFLSRLSETDDIVVVSPVTGRRHSTIKEKLAGQRDSSSNPQLDFPYSMILDDVKSSSINLFEELVSKLNIQRQPGRHPLGFKKGASNGI